PELLEKMRTLAQSGQIDIVSFHYADQLFIGYPQADWERSQELTRAAFEHHDVPLSRTVFCQEGQAAPGMSLHMGARGYRNMVWPKNLWSFQHGDFTAAPLYNFGDVFMVVGGQGVSTPEVEVTWTFLDDGELLATGDLDPYFVEYFVHNEEAVAEYEAGLVALEEQGYQIVTVDKYVDAVQTLVTPAEPPPLIDGTWQPGSTVGVKRWLGGFGLWQAHERDNHVRTLGAIAHRELVAAETIAAAAPFDARDKLDSAWRLLFLGQVTDASGINPYRGEIQYGIAHLAEATRIAREVIRDAKFTMGLASVLIDPVAQTAVEGESDGIVPEPASALLTLVIEAGDRSVSERWERLGDGHHRVVIDIGAGQDTFITVRFPGVLEEELHASLALADATPAVIRRSDFVFEDYHLALPTGLVGLGGGRFVVKDMAHVHLAAAIRRDSGDVVFEDETVPTGEAQRWMFHVIDDLGRASDLAVRINATRSLVR
ncbi:MAG TPA: hypothetical protein VFB62_27635, partial [Polyangiaceae bacterium]|nr:hypothetical protein [Polyangiaceae bacterium]